MSSSDIELSLEAGHRIFTYRLSEDKVNYSLQSPEVVASVPLPKRRSFEEEKRLLELAGILAAPAGATGVMMGAATISSKLPSQGRAALLAGSVVVGLGGGAIGFALGYDDSLNYESPIFLKGLRSEETWRSFAQTIHYCGVFSQVEPGEEKLIATAEGLFQSYRLHGLPSDFELRHAVCHNLLGWAKFEPPEISNK